MARLSVKLFLDLDTLGFGGTLQVPSSLKDLLEKLPGGAASLLDWMPDITLGELGLAFASRRRSFSLSAEAGIAGSADPAATSFLATLPDPSTGEMSLVVGLALTTPVSFDAVPVLGSLMSGIGLDDLALAYATGDIPAGAVLLPPPVDRPSPPFKKGLSLTLTLESGGAKRSFALVPSTGSSPSLRRLGAAGENGGPALQWFNVDKKLGPLTLGRLGLATGGEWLGIGFDAALSLTGLTVSLVGFTAAFPKDDISLGGLRLSLDGLAVYFNQGSILILGSLVRRESRGVTSYDGSLLIQAGSYGIAAIGSFAQVQGAVSLFIFGAVQGVFGGPPAFVVTGIAAGFGYNRGLKIPTAEEVLDFPLVLVATLGKAYLPDPQDVAAALGKLDAGGFVPPRLGSYWFAAGLQFSSFQVLSTFALLLVEFGNDLVIALLGVSSLKLPRGPGVKPYAFAEMTLSAVLRPLEGSFAMKALLTPASFVLDPSCRLTGGFAFYLWFGRHPHAGDFVVTLGGYNPNFTPPSWYPTVPRLGFVWDISSELKAEGGAYFALTPSAIMAGGALAVRFESGALKAWFTAHADFILWWKPFYFDVDVGVSIGASYTADFGVAKKTFTVELSAAVHLWGPKLAGTARVKWWVISFDIDINGGGRPHPPTPTLSGWDEFAATYFPAGTTARLGAGPPGAVLKPLVTRGLLAEREEAGQPVWRVAPELALASETLVPATTAVIAGPSAEAELRFGGPQVGVYPLGSVKLESRHTLRLETTSGEVVDLSGWEWSPTLGQAPESLWGLENTGQAMASAELLPALLGLRGLPRSPRLVGPPAAPQAWLAFTELEQRPLPLADLPPIDGSAPPGGDAFQVVEQTLTRPDTTARREALVEVMRRSGLGPDLQGGHLDLLAGEVRYAFQAPPMLGPLGSTGPRQPPPEDARAMVGSARAPATRGPSSPAARRGADPRLVAAFRPGPGALPAHLAAPRVLRRGAFSPPAERTLLAHQGGKTALLAGGTAVFEVAQGSGRRLVGDGALPLLLLGFDRQDRLCQLQVLRDAPAGAALSLEVARLVVQAGPTWSMDQEVSWEAGSRLLLLAPQALLGERALIRPQSPLVLPGRRRAAGRRTLTGADLTRLNLTLGEGPAHGWTETVLPPGARSLAVHLSRGSGAAGAPTAAEVHAGAWSPAAGRLAGLTLGRAFFAEEQVTLVYPLPAAAGPALRVMVRPPPGFAQAGLLASTARPAELELGRTPTGRMDPPAMTGCTWVEVS